MPTLAKGGTVSRGAQLGQRLGDAFGASFAPGFTDRADEIKLVQQYDPVRQVLSERLNAAPITSPGQQLLQGLTQDPVAFAKAMEDPQTIAALTGTANLATAPTVERDPADQAIRFIQMAEQAEAAGDTLRPPILRARAAQLVPPIEEAGGTELDVFISQGPDGNQVVQRNPETGKWTDQNGAPIVLGEEAMIFKVSDLQSGTSPREIRNDVNGIARYTDTQEPVFPGVEALPDADKGSDQDAIFADRAATASQAIDTIGGDFTSFFSRIGERLPKGAQNEERQLFDQAGKDFVTAVLRPESGAQINASEFADAAEIYIPAPGDSPAVLQAKAASRASVVAGLQIMAGSSLSELQEARGMATVEVGGVEYIVGSVIKNSKDQTGIIMADGTVDILGE